MSRMPSIKRPEMGFMLIQAGKRVGMDGIHRQAWPARTIATQRIQQGGFIDSWASRSAVWASRHGIGEAIDRYLGLHQPHRSHELANFFGEKTSHIYHSDILKMDTQHIRWKDLNWQNFKSQVSSNTHVFRDSIRPENIKYYFEDISLKGYARGGLWKGNIQPVQELMSGTKANLFKNLTYTGGLGFMGFSIAQTARRHYRYWKGQEDGSIASQWRTAYHTSKATLKKALQSLATWEAAGIGMTLGRALIPIGSFPIGGILVGALLATSVYKQAGKWLGMAEK